MDTVLKADMIGKTVEITVKSAEGQIVVAGVLTWFVEWADSAKFGLEHMKSTAIDHVSFPKDADTTVTVTVY